MNTVNEYSMVDREEHQEISEERPPVFGSWPAFYAAVVVWLGLLIVFFYFFTRYFST